MRKTFSFALALTFAAPLVAVAQVGPDLPAPSPSAQVMQRVGLTDMTVTYSSPGRKGRKIYGKLVPYGKVWRTGANAATKIEFSTDIMFGATKVPAGTYAIFTIPAKKGWTVILNSNTEQGGTGQYDEKLDVARVKTKAAWVPRRERMTFMFSNTTEDSTRLDLEWDRYRVSVPIKVDTTALVASSIEKATGGVWRPDARAANYLLDKGNLEAALTHIQKSVAIKSHWYNNWVHAQVLKKMKKANEAKTAAETALAKGDDSGAFKFYQPQIKAVAGVK